MKQTAYGDATVRQVMDMRIGVRYSENYADPKAEVFDYARAGGLLPAGPDYKGPKTFYEFLQTVQKEGEHGQAFAYKTVNAEVLAWIIKRQLGHPNDDGVDGLEPDATKYARQAAGALAHHLNGIRATGIECAIMCRSEPLHRIPARLR